MTVCSLFWFGPVTNEVLGEEVGHDHVFILWKPVLLQSSELLVVNWEGEVGSQIADGYSWCVWFLCKQNGKQLKCAYQESCYLKSWNQGCRRKYDILYFVFRTYDSSATKLSLMIHHWKPECSVIGGRWWSNDVKWGILDSLASLPASLSVPVSGICLDNIIWAIEPFVTKWGMVVHHDELECHMKRLVCYLED